MKHMHDRVLSVRAWVQWGVRALGVVMVFAGAVMVANRVLYAVLGPGDIRNAWNVWNDIGELHGVYLGAPLALGGVAAALLAPKLARWIVRPPERGCAACGHADLDDSGRCSECGRG